MNNYNKYNYDWYFARNMNNNFYPNMNNMNQNTNLFNPKEGFEKGNIFENLYSEYKNYKPQNLRARSEQERKLLEIQTIGFMTHDLNLYLDIHPTDQSMLMLFNDYRRKKEELVREYEKQYGPMTIGSEGMDSQTFEWENTSWPWEVNNV